MTTTFSITVEPTPELWPGQINGCHPPIPFRVWRGFTNDGIQIEAYVLAIVPVNDADAERLKQARPAFMTPARDAFNIALESGSG